MNLRTHPESAGGAPVQRLDTPWNGRYPVVQIYRPAAPQPRFQGLQLESDLTDPADRHPDRVGREPGRVRRREDAALAAERIDDHPRAGGTTMEGRFEFEGSEVLPLVEEAFEQTMRSWLPFVRTSSRYWNRSSLRPKRRRSRRRSQGTSRTRTRRPRNGSTRTRTPSSPGSGRSDRRGAAHAPPPPPAQPAARPLLLLAGFVGFISWGVRKDEGVKSAVEAKAAAKKGTGS